MKILKDPKYLFFLILLLFSVINLFQSYFTNLFEDEAYYYVWSKNLAFGYFDHPPMVALWAAVGSLFAPEELGLRILSIVGFSGMLWLIWLMIDLKEKWQHVLLFFTIVVSMVFWQVFGFIMTPDTPLLFFTALFLLAYKRFLINESTLNIFFLGFSMAAMLYSKYHGVLVIGFIIMSHWKLLKNGRFWLAGIMGLILFLPHLYWQYENGFPSLLYHLKERNNSPYTIDRTLIHFANMIVVVGITFPLIYKAFYKQKVKGQFEKSLKYIVYGFFIFFFFSSFKNEPQAQWVVIILIPLTLLTFPYFVEKSKARKWLKILGGTQLALIMIIRVFFAAPSISPIVLEPHISEQWIPELHEKTEGKPIVFVNSYSGASLYNFYTGIKTHSYSILKGRKSQYNLLDFEANMQGEQVYSATPYVKDQPILTTKGTKLIYGKPISNYQTFEKASCIINSEQLILKPGENKIDFTITNTYNKNITFDNVRFIGVFQAPKKKVVAKVPLQTIDNKELKAFENRLIEATFICPDLPKDEDLYFRVAIEFYNLLEGYQGNKVPVVQIDNN